MHQFDARMAEFVAIAVAAPPATSTVFSWKGKYVNLIQTLIETKLTDLHAQLLNHTSDKIVGVMTEETFQRNQSKAVLALLKTRVS